MVTNMIIYACRYARVPWWGEVAKILGLAWPCWIQQILEWCRGEGAVEASTVKEPLELQPDLPLQLQPLKDGQVQAAFR